MPIRSFKCSETESLFNRVRVKRFANIESVARRKLMQLDAAATLDFLRVPPGNRLQALAADRKGQHSIRISSVRLKVEQDQLVSGGRQFGLGSIWLQGA